MHTIPGLRAKLIDSNNYQPRVASSALVALTHRRRREKEAFSYASDGEANKLCRHHYQPLIHEVVRLVAVHSLYGDDVRLWHCQS